MTGQRIPNAEEVERALCDDREWRAVIRNDAYQVSNDGFVRRVRSGRGARAGLVLSPIVNNWGYFVVNLCLFGKKRSERVAELVAEAFIGVRPIGLRINHKNGIKTDNRVENLEYVTKSQDIRHAYALGLMMARRGVDNHNAKFTPMLVRTIRRLHGVVRGTELAKMFGVTHHAIYGVFHRKNWGWLK